MRQKTQSNQIPRKQKKNQTSAAKDGNSSVQQLIQSENLSVGQAFMQEARSVPSSPPVHEGLPPGNFVEQQVTQSANPLSAGQLCTQVAKSDPSSPPVQESPPEHRCVHSSVQIWKTGMSLGHASMHATKDPPGHPPPC